MANVKISELAAAGALTGAEQVPVVQGAITKRATLSALLAVLVDAAPGTLDTLNELAAALGDDANFAATMTAALAGKEASGVAEATVTAHEAAPDPHAAYATDTDLTAHAADTTAVHGIADTAVLATNASVAAAIDALVTGAPGALDTLNELAEALGDDADFAGSVTAALAGKAATGHDHGATAVVLALALSDETTAITTGDAKLTFRMPHAMTLTAVRASLSTASSAGIPTVDINEGGSTILSTKLTIDASEKTSTTAAVPPVISDAALADDAEVTFDIDVAGTGAKGLKVYLIGTRP